MEFFNRAVEVREEYCGLVFGGHYAPDGGSAFSVRCLGFGGTFAFKIGGDEVAGETSETDLDSGDIVRALELVTNVVVDFANLHVRGDIEVVLPHGGGAAIGAAVRGLAGG